MNYFVLVCHKIQVRYFDLFVVFIMKQLKGTFITFLRGYILQYIVQYNTFLYLIIQCIRVKVETKKMCKASKTMHFKSS